MKWFQDLSFRYKLTLPLGVIAVVFVVFAWSAVRRADLLAVEVVGLVESDMPTIVELLQADRDLYQSLVAERTLIFMEVGTPLYAEIAAQHGENIEQARDRVRHAAELVAAGHLAAIPEIRDKLESFETLRQRWEEVTRRVVQERGRDTREGRSAAIGLTLREARVAFDQMREQLDELEDLAIAQSNKAAERAESEVANGRIQTLVYLGVSLVILVVVMFSLPRLVIVPMERLLHRIQDIADGEGDLTVRLTEGGQDETGQLASAFNRLLAKLQQLVARSVVSAKQVDDAVERLAMVSIESDEAMMEQLTQIQMVATAVNQMAATVNQIAVNTAHAADSASAADTGVRSGARVVDEASAAIGQLVDLVTRATDAIAALESETSRIGSVLEVIKGIADQTSLLALNAAIEAARAGESGRGFAVVAAEVRSLAARTQQSTGEIESMIAALQSSARNVVGVMQTGRGMADTTLQKAAQASQSLAGITGAVADINDMNTQIATAAEEQTAVTEEINGNTLKIQRLAEHAVSASRQTAVARSDLAALAQALHAELVLFKV